jgi:hypothetical protein
MVVVAVDSRNKRASAIGTMIPVPSVLPNPDGSVSIYDCYQVAYSYFPYIRLGDVALTAKSRDTSWTAQIRDISWTLDVR